ncbi:MAG TPA: ABC transporter permease, partial [bacterium]|nr:ABC transporter permease [bacterium]
MPRKPYAFDNYPVIRSNQNGIYSYGPTHPVTWLHFGFGATFDERGQVKTVADRWSWRFLASRLNLLDCFSGYVVLPSQIGPLEANAYKAKGNSVLELAKSYTETVDGVFLWYCEDKIDAIKYFGLQSVVGLANGPDSLQETSEQGEKSIPTDGIGFPTRQVWTPPSSARRSASDLWRLNESRLELLRSKDIINNSVEELHGHAEDLMLQAGELPSLSTREALANSAFLIERPVYLDTKTTLDDLIRAVLILLGLCVPFAFAVERLLIGATTIYRQIAGFTGFFLCTFLILFFTHPAFAISATPIVIFLGFAVVVLSSLVIFIIMRKFEVELKVLQGLTSTVHAADVSRFSTVMAAMSMGISTMRRRPLRTFLTATTIILLTFTILCFASFGTQTGIVRLFLDASPDYSGVFVHDVNWSNFNLEVLDVLRGRWSQTTTICPRMWISPKTEQNQGPLLTHEDGSAPLALKGVLGLASEEIALRPDLQNLMGTDTRNWDGRVFITQAVSEYTGLKEGDAAIVGGLRLSVGKILEGSQLATVTDMDRNSILPVDFVTMQSVIDTAKQQQQQQRKADTLAREVQQNWAHLPTDSVVIVSLTNARIMGANLHAVTLYTSNNWSAAELAADLAKVLDLSISATRPEGVFRHTLGLIVQASGAKDLFFPVVLGGLVIFGTMLGSVADREREIYTFSSLGLAPPHVASLFFAEAMVYSVLGGMGGYLIAQAMMKMLSFLAGL